MGPESIPEYYGPNQTEVLPWDPDVVAPKNEPGKGGRKGPPSIRDLLFKPLSPKQGPAGYAAGGGGGGGFGFGGGMGVRRFVPSAEMPGVRMGMRIPGSIGQRTNSGYYFNSVDPFGANRGVGGGPAGQWVTDSPTDPLMELLRGDVAKQQGLMDEQWKRNEGRTADLEKGVNAIPGQFQGVAQSIEEMLGGIARGLEKTGQEGVQQAEGAAGDISRGAQRYGDEAMGMVRRAEGDINRGYELADQTANEYAGYLSKYQDHTVADAAVIADAIRKNNAAEGEQTWGAMSKDDPMRLVTKYQSDQATKSQVQQAIVPLFSQFNERKMEFAKTLGEFRTAAAAMRESGAQIRNALAGTTAQIGQGVAQTELGAQAAIQAARENMAKLADLSTSLWRGIADIQAASVLNQVQLEQEGRTRLAQLTAQNPHGMVSLFQGMLAMYAVQAGMEGGVQLAGNMFGKGVMA